MRTPSIYDTNQSMRSCVCSVADTMRQPTMSTLRLALVTLLVAACGPSGHPAPQPPELPPDAAVAPAPVDAGSVAEVPAAPAADAGPKAPGGAATRPFVRSIPDDQTWQVYSRTLGSDTF